MHDPPSATWVRAGPPAQHHRAGSGPVRRVFSGCSSGLFGLRVELQEPARGLRIEPERRPVQTLQASGAKSVLLPHQGHRVLPELQRGQRLVSPAGRAGQPAPDGLLPVHRPAQSLPGREEQAGPAASRGAVPGFWRAGFQGAVSESDPALHEGAGPDLLR